MTGHGLGDRGVHRADRRFTGYGRGLFVGALSLAGFVGGAFIGTRVGPLLIPDGAESPYAPIFGLVGALLAGAVLATGTRGDRAGSAPARASLRALDVVDGGPRGGAHRVRRAGGRLDRRRRRASDARRAASCVEEVRRSTILQRAQRRSCRRPVRSSTRWRASTRCLSIPGPVSGPLIEEPPRTRARSRSPGRAPRDRRHGARARRGLWPGYDGLGLDRGAGPRRHERPRRRRHGGRPARPALAARETGLEAPRRSATTRARTSPSCASTVLTPRALRLVADAEARHRRRDPSATPRTGPFDARARTPRPRPRRCSSTDAYRRGPVDARMTLAPRADPRGQLLAGRSSTARAA